MTQSSIRTKTLSNMLWRFAERSAAQIIQFIVSIVLARILLPEAYGTVAIVLAITQILQVFVDSGFASALIQKKDADNIDFSSVFYFNVILCLLLYIIMFFAAPLIALFYNNSELTLMVRVISLLIIISGLKNVQQAYVSRKLQFRKFFFATLGGTIASAIVGITVALCNGGAWAIIAQKLTNVSIDTIVLWFTVGWKPQKAFSLQRLKGLFSFGSKLLCVSIANSLYINLRQLITGKIYTSSDLGFYNQGNQLPNAVVSNINTAIDSVLLSVLSNEQENINRVRNMTRKSIKVGTFVMAPLMFGLAGTASNVVSIILTEKWLPCVPFMRVFCIIYLFYPIATANYNALKALGHSETYLRIDLIQKAVGITILIITMWISPLAIAYGMLVSTIINQIVISWPNRKLLNYQFTEMIKDIVPNLGLGLVMFICVFSMGFIPLNKYIILLLQIICGAIVYILGSKITKNESFLYLLDLIKPYLKRKRNG